MELFLKNILNNHINLKDDQIKKLIKYSNLIFSENQKYNLTGHKQLEKIIEDLIAGSIIPLSRINVPRRTLICDIGTGSGIPSIPLSISFPEIKFSLVEANKKKCDFINMAIGQLGIENVEINNYRAEDWAKKNTSKFDICLTRAFGPIYYSLEFGMPALKKNGYLYIFSNLANENLSPQIVSHCKSLGGTLESYKSQSFCDSLSEGLLFKKIKSTPLKYPRRFPIIKKAASLIPETD